MATETSMAITVAISAAHKERDELERRAGIASAVESARNGPLFPTISSARIGSEQYRRETEEERTANAARSASGVRAAYFSVSDVELRKSLIAKHRELESLYRKSARQEVIDAQADLKSEMDGDGLWWKVAAIIAVVLVAAGQVTFGTAGAIAGGLVAYFCGRQLEMMSERDRLRNTQIAESVLKQAKTELDDALTGTELFSLSEETSGTTSLSENPV